MNSIIETGDIGRNFVLGEFSVVRGCVTIGDDVEIREHCIIGGLPLAYSGQKRLIPTGKIIIGDNVFINSHCDVIRALKDRTVIGDNVIIGQRVIIGHEARIHNDVKIMNSAVLNGHVTVKERSLIGSGAIIRERATIGEHTVIGMGSIVTKDVPDNVIAYGNPCTVHGNNTLPTWAMRRMVKEAKKMV